MQHALTAGRAQLQAELAAALLGSPGSRAQRLAVQHLSSMQQLPWTRVQLLLCFPGVSSFMALQYITSSKSLQ